MKRIILVLALALVFGASWASTAGAGGGPPVDENGCTPSETFFQGTCHPNGESLTFCHVAGLASDPANYITLTTAIAGAVGQAGHFGENGTPNAGHEQDTVGACNPPEEPPEEPAATIAIDCDEATFTFSGFPEGTNVVELDISVDGASAFSDFTDDVSFEGPTGEASVSLGVTGEAGVQAHATWLAGEGGQASLGVVLECEEPSGTTGGTTAGGGGSSSSPPTGGTTGGTTAIPTSASLPQTGFDVWIPLTFAGGFLALGFSALYGPRLLARWRSK